jgi:natural product precursor
MKAIKRLKLDNLSKEELKNRELNLAKGGKTRPPCPCTCHCPGKSLNDTDFGSVSGEAGTYMTIYC